MTDKWSDEDDLTFEGELKHEGVLRKSGRYPWGSGENPNQRNKGFLDHVNALQKKGLSEVEIAEGLGIRTTELRAAKAIAKAEQKDSNRRTAEMYSQKGMSNVAIGEKLGMPEASVRALLKPAAKERNDILGNTANILKDNVKEHGFVDVGTGNEHFLGVSTTQLSTAVAMLREEGYSFHYVNVPQVTTGNDTKLKVLAAPGVDYKTVLDNKGNIVPASIGKYSEDHGRTFREVKPPVAVSSKRVGVRYAEDGGSDMDGVIQVRRGVDDVSLGGSKYAQVRISVDGTHYLKGMAMYADDLPPGVDLMFNTNKSTTGNKLDAMKKIKDDPENPFGAVVKKQRHYIQGGKEKQSAINVVNEEGDWDKWSKNLSSQVLSKQPPALAKQQLDLKFQQKKAEYDEIMALTNPAVKRKLLESFSDDMDSSSVHLKAAALPRQRTQVILPFNSLKDTEVFAPNFRDGEKVALVRYPHGGIFEIPELTVNNRNAGIKKIIGDATDAIGINAKVAGRLSGADFDGDTVLVIPNNSRSIKTKPPLQGLKDFDPMVYKLPDDAPKMSPKTKQTKMGDVSNLITDMTIRGASDSEIARAVRHSMVVIDAEKHHLDYKRSHADNGIAELKKEYQGSSRSGASTLISKASSAKRIDEVKPRSAANGGPVDKKTGKKMFEKTDASYVNADGTLVKRSTKTTYMADIDDAFKLSSGTPMESVYANHANKLKDLANSSRVSYYATKPVPYSPEAKRIYAPQVESLKAKVALAQRNAPLERRAQVIANTIVSTKRSANPDMDSADLKKIKGLALRDARERVNAKKAVIDISPNEWLAIQSGALSNNMVEAVLRNSKEDQIRELATPRKVTSVPSATLARAKAMTANGKTRAEIADALGVPATTLFDALSREE